MNFSLRYPLRLHHRFDHFDGLLRHEKSDVPRFGEIDEGREKGPVGHGKGLPLRRGPAVQPGHEGRKGCPPDAVACRVDRRVAADRACDPDRLQGAAEHVVVEGHVAHGGIGVFPADDEHGKPLLLHVTDKAHLRREIEDVVLVDPGLDENDGDGVGRLPSPARTGSAPSGHCGRRPPPGSWRCRGPP